MTANRKHWPERILMSDWATASMVLPLHLAQKRHVVLRLLAFVAYPPWVLFVGAPILVFVLLPCMLAAMWYDVKDGL